MSLFATRAPSLCAPGQIAEHSPGDPSLTVTRISFLKTWMDFPSQTLYKKYLWILNKGYSREIYY